MIEDKVRFLQGGSGVVSKGNYTPNRYTSLPIKG